MNWCPALTGLQILLLSKRVTVTGRYPAISPAVFNTLPDLLTFRQFWRHITMSAGIYPRKTLQGKMATKMFQGLRVKRAIPELDDAGNRTGMMRLYCAEDDGRKCVKIVSGVEYDAGKTFAGGVYGSRNGSAAAVPRG